MTQESLLRPSSASEKKRLNSAVMSWAGQLTGDAAAYLEGRGIGPTAQVGNLLGVVSGDASPEYRRYQGMLSIPYLDRNRDALTVRFRCLKEHNHREFGHGKYMSLPEEPSRMYGVPNIFEAGDVIAVTEGELDAIVLTECGVPSVAIPGSHNWKAHHRRMLAGFSTIYVCGDPDEAGMEFNRTVTKSMPRALVLPLRDGDISDLWQAGGADAIHKLIEEASK